jgi:hypothetical protein
MLGIVFLAHTLSVTGGDFLSDHSALLPAFVEYHHGGHLLLRRFHVVLFEVDWMRAAGGHCQLNVNHSWSMLCCRRIHVRRCCRRTTLLV